MKGLWEGSYKPCTPEDHQIWLKDIMHWRNERRIRIGYYGADYEIPELLWTQSSFMQPKMMVQDRFLYDSVAGKYIVDRYLDEAPAARMGMALCDATHGWLPLSLGQPVGRNRRSRAG